MNLLAQSALFLWIPIVVAFFTFLPPKKAVITSYVAAWLALPNIGYSISGAPDFTKMTATVVAVLICLVVFNQKELFLVRLRWYDLPMITCCLCPFGSAIMNGLGSYEGASAMLEQIVNWGLPYLIGRVYLTDLDSMRDLALGIAIGGLIYMPLCLFEIRFSPVLETWVYGTYHWEALRYGGYRPKVFLSHGLELGLWMTNASLVTYQIWASGAVKLLRGLPFGKLTLALIITTVLCKSTGALSLLLAGVMVLWLTRRLKRSWAVWLLIAIVPAYTISRAFNLWSGAEAVAFSQAVFGEERASSFEYRLNMENQLAKHALDQPIFGWGRFNRNQILNSQGQALTVPDGYWIIVLGVNGLLGLTALVAMMLQPMVLTIRRFPISTWSDPRVGPVVALALMLLLTMIDFLSNGMQNPIYALTMGGVVGQSAVRLGSRRREAEASLAVATELMVEGRLVEAEQEFRQAIEFASDGDDVEGRRVQAESFDGLGHMLLATGRVEAAEQAFREALAVRDWLAAKNSEPGRFRDLAIAREGLSRTLCEIGRTAEAIEERQIALQIWEILATDYPRNVDYREHRIDALNDLAWLLATDPDPKLRDPARALHLAEEAVSISADHVASWNTLGVARYRAGDWAGAIEVLERSALSSPDSLGTAFDHFFLAMAWCQLQHEDRGREWYERGVAWVARHRPGHPVLERFREEANSLLPSESGRASLEFS